MNGKTIGIIGGGQLGRMLTLAAKPLGFHVVVIDPTPNCPAAQVGAEEITAALDDKEALTHLADLSDYITIEIEHIDVDALTEINTLNKPINPLPATIKIIQDKLWQKQLLLTAGVPIADFRMLESKADAEKALREYGAMLIKTRRGAYDGRGNMVAKNSKDIEEAFKLFKDRELYVEKFVSFKKELAVIVARGHDGSIRTFPVVETIHKHNICHEVLVPAPISEEATQQALKLADQTAKLLKGTGVFAIEMFLTNQNEVLVNEIAPRVHNSGHLTIEACRTSQFEQHVRAITGLPLGRTDLVVPAAVMINILGERDGKVDVQGLEEALRQPQVSAHIYGKSPTKVERKMGHITATGNSVSQARKRARRARKKLVI